MHQVGTHQVARADGATPASRAEAAGRNSFSFGWTSPLGSRSQSWPRSTAGADLCGVTAIADLGPRTEPDRLATLLHLRSAMPTGRVATVRPATS